MEEVFGSWAGEVEDKKVDRRALVRHMKMGVAADMEPVPRIDRTTDWGPVERNLYPRCDGFGRVGDRSQC